MDPEIVIGSKKMYGEFPHLVGLLLNVVRYTLRMTHF
jgi:hypothetical protein